MPSVNMREAKTHRSRLVEAIEQGEEREIVIARHGRPVARLVPIHDAPLARRIGVAKGCLDVADDIDAHDDEVARLFGGSNAP